MRRLLLSNWVWPLALFGVVMLVYFAGILVTYQSMPLPVLVLLVAFGGQMAHVVVMIWFEAGTFGLPIKWGRILTGFLLALVGITLGILGLTFLVPDPRGILPLLYISSVFFNFILRILIYIPASAWLAASR